MFRTYLAKGAQVVILNAVISCQGWEKLMVSDPD
jgi:hypothetical protein